jgi:hypothetical protein
MAWSLFGNKKIGKLENFVFLIKWPVQKSIALTLEIPN